MKVTLVPPRSPSCTDLLSWSCFTPARASLWPQKPKPLFKGWAQWHETRLTSLLILWSEPFTVSTETLHCCQRMELDHGVNIVGGGLRVLQKFCLWQIHTSCTWGTENSEKFKTNRTIRSFFFFYHTEITFSGLSCFYFAFYDTGQTDFRVFLVFVFICGMLMKDRRAPVSNDCGIWVVIAMKLLLIRKSRGARLGGISPQC